MSIDSYVVITPAKNEESIIRFTLDSMVAQTIKPDQWVIVDDGSTDGTGDIVQSYAWKYHWIKLIKNSPEEVESQGGEKIIRAFTCGYNTVDIPDYDFIVKLDADLTLPPNYFEEICKAFEANTRIGMCGGYCSYLHKSGWKREKSAYYHLRGAIKAYRRACFNEIGGIKPVHNWDFLDEMKTMSLGWEVKILPLEVKHHRRTSTIINRGLRYSYEMGGIYYKDGYDFFLTFLRSVNYGLSAKPYIFSAFALLLGYIIKSVKKPQKDVDVELGKFIRKFQYNRIKKLLQMTIER